jgi:hypothetical protein
LPAREIALALPEIRLELSGALTTRASPIPGLAAARARLLGL